MTVTVKLSGFAELDKELERLSKSMGRGVLRRGLMKAAKPLAQLAASKAPVDPVGGGTLRDSIMVGAKLNGRQTKLHRRMFRDDRSSIELFVGPSYLMGDGGRHGHLQEFGTEHHGPQPFMRPAWDQDQNAMLERLSQELWSELEKAIKRADRRAAREA
ncbi:HK97-gp10 family putative phage morphogenesis protein [Paracoccus sp. (in: a-proteobacteria)]|uniref:HK97-gp10 family putative phage morphogenesis protein n=1 Tax=Paracoccus sp. TaxID=267 RepID=UPI00272A03EB|nr:HK97-gp10 family putative phage morphogenesis protein [Paracoccus sp. (in: a-proteobacteria)]